MNQQAGWAGQEAAHRGAGGRIPKAVAAIRVIGLHERRVEAKRGLERKKGYQAMRAGVIRVGWSESSYEFDSTCSVKRMIA